MIVLFGPSLFPFLITTNFGASLKTLFSFFDTWPIGHAIFYIRNVFATIFLVWFNGNRAQVYQLPVGCCNQYHAAVMKTNC